MISSSGILVDFFVKFNTVQTPLVDKEVILEKFPGKGGWTYARLPGLTQEKKNPFGWRRVRGSIDGYEIKAYHLMPMGNGELFLPVKAQIRKAIKKKDGDKVKVILFEDDTPVETPKEFLECLLDYPEAFSFYQTLSESAKKNYIEWIYSAKSEDIKIERIVAAVKKLEASKRFDE